MNTKTQTATTETAVTKKELAALKAKRRSEGRPTAKTTKKDKAAKNGLVRKGKLGSLLGHSVISVMRAMGKHGWNFEQVQEALAKNKIEAADHTVRRALK